MLIESIEQLREVINVSKATTFDRLFNHLFNAEQKYIFPLIGSDMYEKLADFLNNPDSNLLTRSDMNTDFNAYFYVEVDEQSTAYARLLYTTQQAIAHLAFYEGFDILNALVDETGFKRIETNEKKALFKYQEDNIRNYYKETGLNLLDNILLLLETNIDHFPEYDEQLSLNKSRIIPDTKTFNSIINIRNSRIIYLRLLQHMKTVEELELAPVVGAANMTIIYDGIKASTVPDAVKAILPYLQNVVAWSSSVMLMQESGADLTDRGLYFEGIKGGISMNDVKQPASDSRITDLVRRNTSIAMAYMQALKNHLLNNASSWGDYDSPRQVIHNRDNAGKKNFWV
jgi:predicted GIY-YIG superfamily endonuclease